MTKAHDDLKRNVAYLFFCSVLTKDSHGGRGIDVPLVGPNESNTGGNFLWSGKLRY